MRAKMGLNGAMIKEETKLVLAKKWKSQKGKENVAFWSNDCIHRGITHN